MRDPIGDFLQQLGRRGREPLLAGVTATVRFDVIGDERNDSWLLAIKDGELDVSPGGGTAECVIAATRAVLTGIAGGTMNTMAALLRGELAISGDLQLVVAVQRLFPAPPRTRAPQPSTLAGPQPSTLAGPQPSTLAGGR